MYGSIFHVFLANGKNTFTICRSIYYRLHYWHLHDCWQFLAFWHIFLFSSDFHFNLSDQCDHVWVSSCHFFLQYSTLWAIFWWCGIVEVFCAYSRVVIVIKLLIIKFFSNNYWCDFGGFEWRTWWVVWSNFDINCLSLMTL